MVDPRDAATARKLQGKIVGEFHQHDVATRRERGVNFVPIRRRPRAPRQPVVVERDDTTGGERMEECSDRLHLQVRSSEEDRVDLPGTGVGSPRPDDRPVSFLFLLAPSK